MAFLFAWMCCLQFNWYCHKRHQFLKEVILLLVGSFDPANEIKALSLELWIFGSHRIEADSRAQEPD
ncbi:hypothetical protein FVEG_14605 [Fusarium verticillioides 7600]|uniref:Uncharacterized protein n=1 Tax=Gibberella moniliformis (strain M3125 / FGSC 7600) TaxID=334819 RepID=W7LBQ8_GIBM7|nr:hypothetical protein FVEG_14605 [Fusarium verticillioides 7600]EWG36031.1 hypothetical protein FVEG_14605 [Fusarium verticillioides 7600]